MFTSKQRRNYIALLETMSIEWVIKSEKTPGVGMTPMCHLLHRVVIRRRMGR